MSNPQYPQQPGYPQQPQQGYPQQGYEQQGYPQPYQQQAYGTQPPPMQQPAMATPISQGAKTAAIILGISALLIIVGLASKSWFSARGEASIGLTGIEACHKGRCESVSWGDFPKAPADLKAFTYVGLLGGIGCIGVLIAGVVMLLTGNGRKMPWKAFNAVLGITVFGVVSFMFRFMFGEFSKGTSISWAGFVMLAGIIGSSIALVKLVKPETERTT